MGEHSAPGRRGMTGRLMIGTFLTCYFVVLCCLSANVPLERNFFPDEKGRLLLPMFLYEHGTLPTGYEESVRMSPWGFSYANYPLLLSTVIGGMLMKIAGLMTTNTHWIVFAARLVSICSGTLFALFVIAASRVLFPRPVSWLFPAVVVMLPQIIFLSLYFNNDIVALCGSSMILYAWALAMRDRWNRNNVVLLSAGIVIVALSYYNAYSWILMSIIVYLAIWSKTAGSFGRVLRDQSFWRLSALAVVIVLACIIPFFARAAVINHGDFLGLSTVRTMSERYARSEFKPSNRATPKNLGFSLPEMLVTHYYHGDGNNWLLSTFRSTIGVFGQMGVYLSSVVYLFYGCFWGIGLCSGLVGAVSLALRREYRNRVLIDGVMVANIVIVVALALQYSYATDYQAQGRYVLPAILSLTYLVVSGWKFLLDTVVRNVTVRVVVVIGLCVAACAIAIYAFGIVYLPASGVI
ncbi:hypothetical protein KIH79_10135 [Bifidobacterium sp. 82T10]|uniref:Glycosyltransferase RgtA/B/C/D-like domain-containing protein n=1 Tax=Bifidobacterium miconis TaxID=2834435 RepID=A0ABS6WGS7_9BIFI|nr:hypothetical protein [Bifidobacterium miconis]MBW3093269.1 hypothetical protein [Bifidobacterium miconis]